MTDSQTSHFVARVERSNLQSTALFAYNRPDTLYIFLHGFGGNPMRTWSSVLTAVLEDERWRASDVLLWGYPSTAQSITRSAEELLSLLRDMYPKPVFDAAGADLAPPPRTYSRLILVAHSLGGVVLRRALLLDYKEMQGAAKTPTTSCALLRLLSPALGGVRVAGWKGAARQMIGLREFLNVALGASPSYHELLPGSPLLEDLARHTEALASSLPEASSYRAKIVWADTEEVVMEREYFWDTPAGRILNTRHSSITRATKSVLDFIVQ